MSCSVRRNMNSAVPRPPSAQVFAYSFSMIAAAMSDGRRLAAESPRWSAPAERLAAARRALRRAHLLAMGVFLLLLTLLCLAVGLLTRGLEPRMVSLIEGVRYLTTAVALLTISWRFPQWTGAYYLPGEEQRGRALGRTARELRYRAFVRLLGRLSRLLPLQMLFACGTLPGSVPAGSFAGIVFGVAVDAVAYWTRRAARKRARAATVVVAVLLLFFGYVLFVWGVLFVINVWGLQSLPQCDGVVTILTCLYVACTLALHGVALRRTRRHAREQPQEGPPTRSVSSASTAMGRMVTSMIVAKLGEKHSSTEDKKEAGDDDEGVEMSFCEGVSATAAAEVEEGGDAKNEVDLEDKEEAGDDNWGVAAPEVAKGGGAKNEAGLQALSKETAPLAEDDEGPTYGQLLCASLRCCCCAKAATDMVDTAPMEPKAPMLDRVAIVVRRILWALVSLFALYCTL